MFLTEQHTRAGRKFGNSFHTFSQTFQEKLFNKQIQVSNQGFEKSNAAKVYRVTVFVVNHSEPASAS